jgi:hypothetical protein
MINVTLHLDTDFILLPKVTFVKFFLYLHVLFGRKWLCITYFEGLENSTPLH